MSSSSSRSGSSVFQKYGRTQAARVPSHQRPISPLEWAVLLHIGIMLAFGTWAFGGGAAWVRTALAWWGSLSIFLILTQILNREARAASDLRPLRWLWPLALFDIITLVACLSPTLRPINFGAELMLVRVEVPSWRPSSARPALALYELWLFNALYLSAFNLAFVVKQRRAIRGLFLFAGANAMFLAVFGTVQKLTHAPGPFFGLVVTPQPFFFASFIYHNHWGAFTVLTTAACLGLLWRYLRNREQRDFFHGPGLTWIVVVLALATTVPLSGSRSCTVLMAVFLGGALLHALGRMVKSRRNFRESTLLPVTGIVLAVALGLGAIWFVARESITARAEKTREQVSELRSLGTLGTRAKLYRDTWAMARDKIWFGWGMNSFPHIFQIYSSIKPNSDRIPIYFTDAHNDWIQFLAEHGITGTVLIALCALLPLTRLRRRHLKDLFPIYLFIGCTLVLLYALLEFPFANAVVVLLWWLSFFGAVKYCLLETPTAPRAPSSTVTPSLAP